VRHRATAFGGIVRQTDAAIVKEARERGPALEHVVHGLSDVVAARELGALLTHPGLQIGDQRWDWAGKTLPTLQHHLEMAQELGKEK